MNIAEISTTYKNKLDYLDIELILAYSLAKTREFVLMHPEYKLTKSELQKFNKLIKRRINNEPIAYIFGHKEFYGLDFIVNKHILIPRPETELMVEQALELLRSMLRNKSLIVDVGTGSGCVITSIAKTIENPISNLQFIGIDISKEALQIARKNANLNGMDEKIKFLHGSLLTPISNKLVSLKNHQLVITANLPYLSKEIYESSADNVKKFEPKSALYSPEAGLQHYRKLLMQIKKSSVISQLSAICLLEISPEQKQPITVLIKSIFPKAKIEFSKDLARKWRICKVTL